MSPSPCLRRLRQLESDGMIFRYVAPVDPIKAIALKKIPLGEVDDVSWSRSCHGHSPANKRKLP